MKNIVDSRNNPKYKLHMLVKCECSDCEREFILSSKYVDDVESVEKSYVTCPYCRTADVGGISWMEDRDRLDDLGCIGIGHLES